MALLPKLQKGMEVIMLDIAYNANLPASEISTSSLNSGEPGKAIKHDQEKNRVDLLPPFVLGEVSKVLTFGAKKYAAHNWRGGFEYSRTCGAALRHIYAWQDREDLDPETGLNHIDHAICELMFLRQHIKDYPQLDDRYKPGGQA